MQSLDYPARGPSASRARFARLDVILSQLALDRPVIQERGMTCDYQRRQSDEVRGWLLLARLHGRGVSKDLQRVRD